MTIHEFFRIGWSDARKAAARHPLLTLSMFVLILIGGSSGFLRGDLLGGVPVAGVGGSSSSEQSLRSCDSTGTMFEGIDNLGDVRDLYKEAMSGVFEERETTLKTPSSWKCGTGPAGEPPIPMLRDLGSRMPGWHYRVNVPLLFGSASVPVMRPVTFASFGSMVAELQREYECKLAEMQDRNIAEVATNQDITKPAQFCCMATETDLGCRQVDNPAVCSGPVTSSPTCDDACPVLIYHSDLMKRMPTLHEDIQRERQVSRVAVERSLATMRSFEMNYAIARQFVCYQRASLDLKNEMSLLADAVSCMPKIWDAVTSIHDRK